jgi:hypothetical protein
MSITPDCYAMEGAHKRDQQCVYDAEQAATEEAKKTNIKRANRSKNQQKSLQK